MMTAAPSISFTCPTAATDEWDRYCSSHPKGSVFHTRKLLEAYAGTPGNSVHAEAAVSPSGRIVALLTAVRVSTLGGPFKPLASRSIMYAEPICDNNEEGISGLRELIQRHDDKMRRRVLFTEIRPLMAEGPEAKALGAEGYERLGYYNYVVDTACGAEAAWLRLSKSCRKHIKQSENRGLTVTIETGANAIRLMYAQVRESYQRSKVPLADESLFHAAVNAFGPGEVQVRIARCGDQVLAGGISLIHRDRCFAWYGGSQRVSGLCPFDCLTWDEIRWCCENGIRYYDFGGAGWVGEEYGPREFKAKFGGELTEFGRYRKVYAKLATQFAKYSYNLLRRVRS